MESRKVFEAMWGAAAEHPDASKALNHAEKIPGATDELGGGERN